MEKISAEPLSIKDLLEGKRYKLSYFQREYSWEKQHIEDLINDLLEEFNLHNGRESEEQKESAYFLGCIIVSGENSPLDLIDGQQRITSLLLILIWIAQQLKQFEQEAKSEIEKILSLVYIEKDGAKIYTLDSDLRYDVMNDLCEGIDPNISNASVSVKNIANRYKDIDKLLYKDLPNDEKTQFVDWLLKNVYVIAIKADTHEDGYKIFESSNDRGLKLSPVDMLKGYLLSNVTLDNKKEYLDNSVWKTRIDEIVNKNEYPADAIKCWLRADYAISNKDFDEIGGDFHRWLQRKVDDKNDNSINLGESEDFYKFVAEDFEFYTRWYLKLTEKSNSYDESYEAIYWNKEAKYTLQFMLMLAAISPSDEEDIVWKKINVVATYIDIFIGRQFWKGKAVAQRDMKHKIFQHVDKIRDKSLEDIATYFRGDLNKENDFDPEGGLAYAQNRQTMVRMMLARFSAWLEREAGTSAKSLDTYLQTGKQGYDIEHIINDKYDDYKEGSSFEDEGDFSKYRNDIGGLLLLPYSVNRSLQNKSKYSEKLKIYMGSGNLLAQTLHGDCFANNPKLQRIRDKLNIPFKPHESFLKEDIRARQKVYHRLALNIWDVERINKAMRGEESLSPSYTD